MTDRRSGCSLTLVFPKTSFCFLPHVVLSLNHCHDNRLCQSELMLGESECRGDLRLGDEESQAIDMHGIQAWGDVTGTSNLYESNLY